MRLCALLMVVALLRAAAAGAEPARFFFSGDGTLELEHGHFAERLKVRYRDGAGNYDSAALARIRHFFRSRESGEEGEVSLRLIELIDFVQDRYRPRRTVLVSGYRSPEWNAALRRAGARAAKTSLHTEGVAADLSFTGVDLRRLWIELRKRQVGGVGYYRKEKFLHLDTGRPRFWEPQTSRVEEDLSRGNARLFARTDFDRYTTLDGALIRLHSVTAWPLAISADAQTADGTVRLRPTDGADAPEEGCYVIREPAASYAFRVESPSPPGTRGRQTIRLRTCLPRTEATPELIETNPVEVGGGEAQAR